MSWDYRIGAEYYKKQSVFLFSIIEVYYDKKGRVRSYRKMSVLSDMENISDLKLTHKLISGAFEKPVISLDNFPEILDINKK